MNQDPIGLDGGDNLYSFAPNTQSWTDTSGLWAFIPYLITGLAVAGRAVITVASKAIKAGSKSVNKCIGKCSKKPNRNSKLDKLSESDKKSIQSYEKLIQQHKKKIEDFKKNPTVSPGMENLPKDIIKKQQERRIMHLEREIKAFEKNINDILNKGR